MSSAVRVLSLSLLALLEAAPAAGAAGGWSAAPAGGGRPSFYAEGGPGTVLRDTVAVTNRGAKALTVRLRGTGAPLAFARDAVRVPARTRAEIPFTVTVPGDAPPGARSARILARDADGRTAAVALRLRVTGPRLSALTVERVALRADSIGYVLVNRGTTALTPRLAVRADGVLGPLFDRAPRTLPVRLAPGSRTELSEPWPGRPALDAVDVRLSVTAAGGAADTAVVSARFVPWGAVTGVAAVLTAPAALLLVRRRRRGAPDAPPPERAGTTGAGT
ncbi:hypothetical protein SZN_36132 [Streptomyces zinciresistens K42]|uniref:DUF916 domain-containing protein n=1 Tax=Streptomyces zinciresistens K42 TaxID=700597 RepID=G2GNX1_9ACTN|nr:hypothetical protein [Streptomyces zinciresistens]EGX54794.1 hypothetical protein SZN_36132 [Streptomyces zinciresistens K42]